MKLGDKLIENPEKYIKELLALVQEKEAEIKTLKKANSDQKIEFTSKLSTLKDAYNEVNKKNTNFEKENANLLKKNKALSKQQDVLLKKHEKTLADFKLLYTQLEILIDHLVNSQLMTRKAIEELYGPSSEKTSGIIKAPNASKVESKEPKITNPRGRKKGTQNFSDWNVNYYEKITDNSELPFEYRNPISSEVGTLVKERFIQKIVESPVRRKMVYKKVGIYQTRDGSTFEVIFDDKDPFGFSACTPSLASYLSYLKCALYLPNDRIEHMFEVQGTPISKQLQYSYLLKTSEFFKIAFDKMHLELLNCNVLHADETTYNNLEAKNNQTNYAWAISSARSETKQAVCYFYKDDRKYENAEMILKDFKGVVVSDRYKAYELEGVKNAFCWSHARRKYTDIIKHLKEDTDDYNTLKDLLESINKIFYLEKSYTKLKLYGDKLMKQRKKDIKPIIDDYFKKIKSLVTEKETEINNAYRYSINGEEGLRLFLSNPLVDPSNNLAENVMRKVAKIRDNSLFSATSEGANATMIILSIVQTCIINLINPEKYINYYLENYKQINKDNIDDYLPYSKKLPADLAYSQSEIEQMNQDLK